MSVGQNYLNNWAKVVDCGDAPLTFLVRTPSLAPVPYRQSCPAHMRPQDNTIALKQLDKSHKVTSSRPAKNTTYTVPRILTLGGDHTTTLSALRSTHSHWGPVSVIHFDSHLDTWDPNVLGGGLSRCA